MVINELRTSVPFRVSMGAVIALACWLTIGRACCTAFASARLLQAARDGRADQAVYWLRHGADVNARDRFGDTPLMYAARNAHPEVVRTLLARGAQTQLHDEFGLTAAHWATFHLRDSRTFPHPHDFEIQQVTRPEAIQTLALLER